MPANVRTSFVLAAVLVPCAAAQDLLHYKFDGACGSSAINYAAGSPAPSMGTIVTNLGGAVPASWTAGRFGLALARAGAPGGPSSNVLDTNWAPTGISGSVSWACWLKIGPSVGSAPLAGIFFSQGLKWLLAGNSLITTLPSTNLVATNLIAMARTGWTHVAVVLDAGALTATYYFNGTPLPPLPIASSPSLSGSTFVIGSMSGLVNLVFDIDEFILANRVMSVAEIAVLATDPRGADAAFGVSGGPSFLGNGQRPIPGNQAYGLTLNASPGLAWLVFGRSRCTMAAGTITLPVDLRRFDPLLSGLQGQVDYDLGSLSLVVGSGTTPIPFPLPNLPGLSGFQCYGQALVLDFATLQFAASNPLAIGIGR